MRCTFRAASERPRSRGLTLVEVVGSIGVVSLLFALLIGGLRGARIQAMSTRCLTTLGGIMQGHAMVSAENGGYWANAAKPGESVLFLWHPGTLTVFGTAYYDQVRTWTPLLIGSIWEQGAGSEMFACPAVYAANEELATLTPPHAGRASYYYSAAMISMPSLWDPSDAAAREQPDRFRTRVAVGATAYPSGKVVMAENDDFHSRKAKGHERNVGFADGHASRVDVLSAASALPFRAIVGPNGMRLFDTSDGIPFSSAAWGASGTDY